MQMESCNLFPMTRTELCGYHFSPLACKSTLSSVIISGPLSLVLCHSASPCQRAAIEPQCQGNFICSPVRRTLTEFNVWFPFMPANARACSRIASRYFRRTFEIEADCPTIVVMMNFAMERREMEGEVREMCRARGCVGK